MSYNDDEQIELPKTPKFGEGSELDDRDLKPYIDPKHPKYVAGNGLDQFVNPTNSSDRTQLLHLLFNKDIWPEELMGELFQNAVERVLSPRERFVLEMKVEGKSEKYIIKLLRRSSPQCTFDSLQQIKSDIKRKLKDGFDKRLPGWIRSKKWNNKEEREKVEQFYEDHPELQSEEEE